MATGAHGCPGRHAVSHAGEAFDHASVAATTPNPSLVARSAWALTPSGTTATMTTAQVCEDGAWRNSAPLADQNC